MLAIPAMDVSSGGCVRVGESPRSRPADPSAVAREWSDLGFRRVHVLDLDAACGGQSNLILLEELVRDTPMQIQIAGGVSSTEVVDRLYHAGADRIVVSGRAWDDPAWMAKITALYPGTIVVSADLRGRRILTRGAPRQHAVDVVDVVEELNALSLGGLLIATQQLEGSIHAADLAVIEEVVDAAAFPVFCSGGAANIDDLRALQHRGVSGTVIGMPLYSGALDARAVATEFAD